MLQAILSAAAASDYDFRKTAEPQDPLRARFDEWVPYYRLKWAIARVLQPSRILELGVRFGYSALAFLDAVPSASYIGIDSDSETFGGCREAAAIARSKLAAYDAQVIVGDTLTYDRFPGGPFDLIHIDGQQDEEGSWHDLRVALTQSRYILVDGYFWTRENFLNVSEFLFHCRNQIRWYGIIPGYAGELLIETNGASTAVSIGARESNEIRSTYTASYYMQDCGGFEAFKRSNGQLLEPRLQALWQLAQIRPSGAALDLGCGRGELAIQFARDGRRVTAVDYSPDAIDIARRAAEAAGVDECIDFQCADAVSMKLNGPYDVVIAGDLVEHMAASELDLLYSRISEALSPDGIFVVHTFPNLWYYRYEHARRRRIAQSVGAYLPANPRSWFERLMHINEQSPRTLRKQLLRHFPYATVWFSGHDCGDPADNLRRRYSVGEMRSAADLFAIASHTPIDCKVLRDAIEMHPLAADDLAKFGVRVIEVPTNCTTDHAFQATVEVLNGTRQHVIKSRLPNPISVAYHWLDARAGTCVVFDGIRSSVGAGIPPCSSAAVMMDIRSPAVPGDYVLRITIVQEYVQWLDLLPVGIHADVPIRVQSSV